MESQSKKIASIPNAADRRQFLKGVGLTGIGLAGATLLANATPANAQSTAPTATATDVEVLNFALNLEYLEAEFYTKAFYGITLHQFGVPISGVGNAGPTTGGVKVTFEIEGTRPEYSGRLRAVAKQITDDEQTHVRLIQNILGSQAIAKPAINLDALGFGFLNFSSFLALARIFEDVGVSAYGGAAPLLSPTTLATAARIALTEAYHASTLRFLCAENLVNSYPVDITDFPPPPVGVKYFDVDDQGLAVVRTPSQVLAIAYGNATPGTGSGGFFPNGVNGAITTV